ncbi:MAG: LysE family translocator [Pikeienuella sp.]|uniref:LysE family translocator n=1 Tax=Pikeienuella sp. TaxID=2831957 RepID=UPI00391DAD0B
MPEFEIATLLAFLLASVALYVTPGADMMFISASGAAGGVRAGLAAALGVSLGSLFHVGLAAGGVAALIAAYPAAYDALRWAGAAYLLWLAWRSWRARPAASGEGAGRARAAFARGALTNMLNPKVSLFVLAFLPQFADPARGPVWLQIALLGALFALASIPFNCLWGALGGALAARVRRAGRALNRIVALVFAGLAARLALG